jgi:hypothetical protein
MLKAKGLLNFMSQNQGDPEKARPKILKMARASEPGAIKDFFEKCHSAGFRSMELAYHTILALLREERDDIVRGLFSASSERDFLYGVYGIGQALSDFKNFSLEPAERSLRIGIYHCVDALGSSRTETFANLGFLTQNAFLLEGVAWPSPARFPQPRLDILSRKPFNDSPYTCFTICDPVYFRHYSEPFIKGLREACGRVNIFILLVNPDDGIIAGAREYDGMTVAAARYDGRWIFEFCTSARFMLAGDILREIGGPAVFLDIDSNFPPGSAEILSKVAAKPLSICDTRDVHPVLRISAALLGAHPTPDAFSFFDAARDFILEDMTRSGPLWGLDQMALYRAACLGRQNGWNISDINKDIEGLGRAPNVFVKSGGEVIPLEERQAIRTNSFYKVEKISLDGRFSFRTIDD